MHTWVNNKAVARILSRAGDLVLVREYLCFLSQFVKNSPFIIS